MCDIKPQGDTLVVLDDATTTLQDFAKNDAISIQLDTVISNKFTEWKMRGLSQSSRTLEILLLDRESNPEPSRLPAGNSSSKPPLLR